MTTKATPGPWTIRGDRHSIFEMHGEIIAQVWKYSSAIGDELPVEANARLIAAAPELLECLIDLVEKAEQVDEELTGPADKEYFSASLLTKCRAATSKALGV